MYGHRAAVVLCGTAFIHCAFSFALPPPVLHKRALGLNDLFDVKTSGDGDCSPYLSDLQTWVEESNTLATSALNAIAGYGNSINTRRSLAAYLGVRQKRGKLTPNDPSELTDVQDWIQAVQDFLSTGQIAGSDEGATPVKLFCSSKWLKWQDPNTDYALKSDSGEVQTVDKDGKEVPVLIADVPDLMKYLEPGTLPNGETYSNAIFWGPDILEYVFERDWGADVDHDYCSVLNEDGVLQHNAGTDTGTLPSTLTVCPSAFDRGYSDLGSINVQVASHLDAVAPQSLTMFHELFHLTQGTDGSFDWCNSPPECIGSSSDSDEKVRKQARHSPECLAYFALDMYMVGNRQISFATGTGKKAGT